MPAEIAKPKMSEGRRSSKPLMEKRRRARINNSLGQLKSLILEATNKDTSRHSKLEKADILEMTVRYLRNMQRHQITGSGNTDPATLNRYRHGYSECINEVSRYLDSSEAAVQLRNQLIGHLANCVPVVSQQQTVAYTPAPTPTPVVATAAMGPGSATQPAQAIQVQIAPSPVNNSLPAKVEIPPPARVVSGIPVGQISTGEITVVLPPQAIQGGQFPSHFIPVYAQSAPSLVSPASSTSSQCLPSPTPSTETPTSPVPTHRVSYQYQQLNQDFSSPTPMEQQQNLPQIVSYPPASIVSSSSLFASSVASTTVHSTAVQPSALVTLPTNVLTPPAEHTHHAVFSQQQHKVPEQHHAFYQSPSKNDLRTVNISVQQQYAAADENVWRPW